MFRRLAVALRPLPTELSHTPRFTRLYSTGGSNASSTSKIDAPKTRWKELGGAGIVLSGAYFYVSSQRDSAHRVSSSSVKVLKDVNSEDEILVVSPVKVLDQKAAEEKLREQVHSFDFVGRDSAKGRVDIVRVSSNYPVEDDWAVAVGKGVGGASTLFAGLYDGHAGWATSTVLRESLIPYVSSTLAKVAPTSNADLVDAAIKSAFVRLDDRILNNAQQAMAAGYPQTSAEVVSALAPAISGSCALLTIYDTKTSILRTAITGDSRAVRGAWSGEKGKYEADVLSKDQTGFNEDEVNRLDKEHPGEKEDILDPKTGRLMGIAITRAFGDNRWKWTAELLESAKSNFWGYAPRPKTKTPPYMTARPEVSTRQVQTEDFVILASDGLWDVMSNEDAVACVSRWLAARRNKKPEAVTDAKTELTLDDDGWSSWKATPEYFAIEDLDNAAVCLAKNALGGSRRDLFRGVMTTYSPLSRYARDDITIQVIFFKDPYA